MSAVDCLSELAKEGFEFVEVADAVVSVLPELWLVVFPVDQDRAASSHPAALPIRSCGYAGAESSVRMSLTRVLPTFGS